MSEIRFGRLTLRNFKGIRDITIEPEGEDLDIFGRNAAGKTTLADGVSWLLFGKDSLGQTDFEIKTLTPSGESLHNLDHEVEGVLLVDGRTITLKRTYHEVYTKRRNEPQKSFTGHETVYHVDGVPVQKKEYEQRIAAIADESAFRLLTSPTFFNEALDWKKRRAILLEVCGDASDAEVIASDKALAKLPEVLLGRSLEDHKKVVAARRKEINKELELLPARIDEATKGLPNTSDVTKPEALEGDIANLRAAIETKRAEKAQVSSGGAVAEARVRLRECEAEIQRVRNEHEAAERERSASTTPSWS